MRARSMRDQYCRIAMARSLLLSLLILLLPACVSGGKKLSQIDEALDHPKKLEDLCRHLVTGACALLDRDVIRSHELSIMQGVTSTQQARLVIVGPKSARFVYYVRSKSSSRIWKVEATRFQRPFSPMMVEQIELFDLDPYDSYELLVLDEWANLWDRREFHSLDLSKKSPRLAFLSCMDDHYVEDQAVIWNQLIKQSPDAVIMMGDNVYADRLGKDWRLADPEQLWNRYVETRNTLAIYKSDKLIPVIATWDDHDYGRNDADRTYPYKSASEEIFLTFFPQAKPAPGFTRGPGVSSVWDAFDLRFVLTDDRSFRSPDRLDIPDQTHFGPDQENWIVEQLMNVKTPVLFISGDQFFGGYQGFESYEGNHPKSFAKELLRWKKTRVPVLFVSGDRHLTEIVQVPRKAMGFATYELTSSPMHATVFADAFLKNPSPHQLRGAAAAGIDNYMLIQPLVVRKNKLEVDVQSFGPKHRLLYERKLKVVR
jgi:hypothetical protein